MTTPKLPEPVARLMTWHGPRDVPSPKITARSFSEYSKWDRVEKRYWHDGELLYTADQVREILEIAAEQLEKQHTWISSVSASIIVRDLKEQL